MPNGKQKKGGIKVIVGYLLTPVIQAAVLFGCAGRMDLPWLWVYLGVSFVGMFGGILPVCIVNPELVNHRGDFKKKKDTKRWDKFLMPVFGFFGFYITWVVIAAAVLVVRTALEDRTLQKELEGYVEYTENTRYRLLPGVW